MLASNITESATAILASRVQQCQRVTAILPATATSRKHAVASTDSLYITTRHSSIVPAMQLTIVPSGIGLKARAIGLSLGIKDNI